MRALLELFLFCLVISALSQNAIASSSPLTPLGPGSYQVSRVTTGAATAQPDGPASLFGAKIPLPPGFSSIQTIAINSKGEAVGSLAPLDGPVIPFLYSGGTMYDLSTVSSELIGAVPSAINDRGEIVLNRGPQSSGSDGVTLLVAPQPQAAGVNPAAGSGYSQSMAFTFTDAAGFAELSVLNILINGALDGSQACYLAYNRAQNVVYLVDNAGVSLVGGVTLGNAETANNSQCAVSGLGSSFTANGDTLTITLALDFNVGFGGHKIVFLAARDGASGNSGWQPLGTWTIVGASPPAIAAPTVGTTHGGGSTQTFMFTFTDSAGWQDIGIVNILVNGALDGYNACYLAYSRPLNALYLVDDAGTGLLAGMDPNGAGTVSNSQCTVSGGISSMAGTGNTLILTLSFQFQSIFAGNRILFAATRTNGASTSNWQAVGVWTVTP